MKLGRIILDLTLFLNSYNRISTAPLGKKHSRLYLLCFAWQRFIKINDNLITYFIYKVNHYTKDADNYSILEIYQAKLADDSNRSVAGKILQLIRNKKIADAMLRPKAYKMMPEKQFDQFTNNLLKPNFNPTRYQWEYYAKQIRSIKLNLSPIFRSLIFNCDKNNKLAVAINFLRAHFDNKKSFEHYSLDNIPTDFMPNKLLRHVIKKNTGKKKHVDGDLYAFMIYLRLKKALESGGAFVKDSINYRHLEDELIPLKVWQRDKDKILRKINNPLFMKPITELLSELEQQLHNQYVLVNNHITSGENKYIKLDSSKNNKVTWHLPYKRQEDSVNNPFYEQLPTCNINDVMRFTAKQTGFLQNFTHIKPKYSKVKIKLENLIGYTVGCGTGIGKNRMPDISDIKRSELQTTEKNFIRLETMRKSNDRIVNYISKLPVFEYYNLSDYGVHVSLDGQKLETKYLTIKSRYSTKHFGLGQGVVSYTLVANHLPINTKIIGANEHESHYVLDIVHSNTSNVDIYAVSGDMHSINRVNFALLHLFGYRFMPRLTSINKKAEQSLVCFKDPFDKIIFSSYMLNYIDDGDLRSTVHRALNRGEAFHQLRSSILKVSGRKLDGRTELELDISNECNRLLANCIICYNASLLSSLLEGYQLQGNLDMVEKIKRLSPVAWQHINLVGKFEFCTWQKVIDLQELTKLLLADSKIGFPATGH